MTRLERKDKIQNQQRTDEVGNQIKVTALREKKVYIVKSAQLSEKRKKETRNKDQLEMYVSECTSTCKQC